MSIVSNVAYSDQNYIPHPGQEPGVKFLGMEGKPGISRANLAVVPLATFLLMLTGADSLQSMNYILSNKDFYNKDKTDTAKIASNCGSYASFVGIFVVLVIGLMYDLIGRRATTVITFCLGSIVTMGVPLVSPNIPVYSLLRTIFSLTLVFMITNPFINDYVKA